MHRVKWICEFSGFDSLVVMTLRFDQPSLRSGRGYDHQGCLIGTRFAQAVEGQLKGQVSSGVKSAQLRNQMSSWVG